MFIRMILPSLMICACYIAYPGVYTSNQRIAQNQLTSKITPTAQEHRLTCGKGTANAKKRLRDTKALDLFMLPPVRFERTGLA